MTEFNFYNINDGDSGKTVSDGIKDNNEKIASAINESENNIANVKDVSDKAINQSKLIDGGNA